MSERSVFREYLEALLIAAVFLGFSNTFVVKTFYIPSSSMENTLLVGDHLFVNRYIFGSTGRGAGALLPERDVRRGDVVIFRSVEDPQVDLVKRCIGVPGDVLQMREKVLTINGKQVDDSAYALYRDPRLFADRDGESPDGRRRDNFGPITVPPEKYFCMGDNRDYSYDSRFWGFLPAENVKGRPVFIYWSYGGETPDGKWRGWADRLQQLAHTALGFVPRTRWARTFHLIR
jgi:signal peptidase I